MIRKYKKSDWDKVREIYDLSKPDEMVNIVKPIDITPLSQDKNMIEYFNESEIKVYEKKQNVLGFIGRKENIISWLFVHPKYRKKGIAKSLLIDLIQTYDKPLKLNLTKSNHVAKQLYLNFGFKIYEEFIGNMYNKQIPALRMELQR